MPHQYSHNFLVGTCTGLYKPVQALKVESLQEKQAMSDFPQVLFSFRVTSYDKPTRQQIKKLKSRDNHIKCVYYTHGPPSLSSPALVVATHHCCCHPPLLLLLLLSPPAIVVTPALAIAALVVVMPTLVITAHPHCRHLCITSVLIVAARPHSLLLPAHCIDPR
jgi:hypothetical protein